jgi:hypothetical protein
MTRIEDIPVGVVACDRTVFEPGEGARHIELLDHVRSGIVGRAELQDGWRLTLDPAAFAAAAEWITYERRCCAFFDFRLDWSSGAPPTLTITGPEGAKAVLAGW